MLTTIVIVEPLVDNVKRMRAIQFLRYAANVGLIEAREMIDNNISWLIETDKSVADLKTYAKDRCENIDVAVTCKEEDVLYCVFCDREATHTVTESNMNLCSACKEAFEYGQARADYVTEEV